MIIDALFRLWRRFKCYHFHAQPNQCYYCDTEHLEIPDNPVIERFDWLRDYGRLWEPDSTAFWLEPETPSELANWFGKYRPTVLGKVEAAGITITLEKPSRAGYTGYASTTPQQLQQMQAMMQNAFPTPPSQKYSDIADQYYRKPLPNLFGNLFGGK